MNSATVEKRWAPSSEITPPPVRVAAPKYCSHLKVTWEMLVSSSSLMRRSADPCVASISSSNKLYTKEARWLSPACTSKAKAQIPLLSPRGSRRSSSLVRIVAASRTTVSPPGALEWLAVPSEPLPALAYSSARWTAPLTARCRSAPLAGQSGSIDGSTATSNGRDSGLCASVRTSADTEAMWRLCPPRTSLWSNLLCWLREDIRGSAHREARFAWPTTGTRSSIDGRSTLGCVWPHWSTAPLLRASERKVLSAPCDG